MSGRALAACCSQTSSAHTVAMSPPPLTRFWTSLSTLIPCASTHLWPPSARRHPAARSESPPLLKHKHLKAAPCKEHRCSQSLSGLSPCASRLHPCYLPSPGAVNDTREKCRHAKRLSGAAARAKDAKAAKAAAAAVLKNNGSASDQQQQQVGCFIQFNPLMHLSL